MSMDDYGKEPDTPVTEQEGTLFAPNPIWERNRKRRGFGMKKTRAAAAAPVSPEPRSFAPERDDDEPMALEHPVPRPDPTTAYAMGAAAATPSTLAAEDAADDADEGLVAPIGRPSTRADRQPRSHGIAPAAIAVGAVGVLALGAVGWFTTRGDDGVPELTPGAVTTSETATAPLPPVDMPPVAPSAGPAARETAAAPPAAAEPPRQTVRVQRQASRTRPAAASASSSGVDASTPATLPGAPQPYQSLNPGAAPGPVNPTPPAQTAPAEPIPSTPPTITPEPSPIPPATDTPPQTTTTPPQ